MDDVLDKVSFQLDADLGLLRAKYAQAEAETTALAAKIKTTTGNAFFSSTQGGSAKIIELQKATRDLAAAQGIMAVTSRSAAEGVANLRTHIERTHAPTITAARHIASMGHELAQGNFPRAAYSLSVLTTHFLGVGIATLAWVAALAAIPIAAGAAAISAENAIDRANRALRSTGFASGVSQMGLMGMSRGLDQPGGLSQRGALDALTILAAHGNVGANNLPGAATAALGLGRATGKSTDEAAQMLEQMLADPAKGAAELDKQFKLFSADMLEQIRRDQERGDIGKAQAEIIQSVNKRFGDLEASSWSLAQAWDSMKHGLSNFWFNTGMTVGGGDRQAQERTLLETAMGGARTDRTGQARAQYLKMVQEDLAAARQASAAGETSRLNDLVKTGVGASSTTDAGRLLGLKDKLAGLNADVDAATKVHSAFKDQITAERDAVAATIGGFKTHTELLTEEARLRGVIAKAGPGLRGAQTRAQAEAQIQLMTDLQNPQTAGSAMARYNATMANAGVGEAAAAEQHIVQMRAQASEQYRLADATMKGADAAMRQKAQGEGYLEFLKGGTTSAKAFADASYGLAKATEAVNLAQAMARQAAENAGLGRLAGSDGSPAALEAMRRHNEAVMATLGDPSKRSAYEAQLKTRDDLNRTTASKQEVFTAQQSLQAAQKEYQFLGLNHDERLKAIADLQTMQKLVAAGYEGQALEDQYQKLRAINEQLAIQKDKTADLDKSSGEMASAITSVLGAHMQHFGSLKSFIADLAGGMAQVIEKTIILIPLEERLKAAMAGQGGIGGIMGQIFGSSGGMSAAGGIDAAIAGGFAKGGAWSGGVRFASSGMVLGGATMFGTANGPVIGGEMGKDSEALVPLHRAPDGKLGIRMTGSTAPHVTIVQHVNIHPDVSGVARAEIARQMPMIRDMAVSGVVQAHQRGVKGF